MELGVSGLLYNSNLVMLDRANNSLYPQIYGSGVLGVDLGQTLPLLLSPQELLEKLAAWYHRLASTWCDITVC